MRMCDGPDAVASHSGIRLNRVRPFRAVYKECRAHNFLWRHILCFVSMNSPNSPPKERVAGYPRLAEQMGLVPESGIFRTFSALNAKNLLYLQAELVTLEKILLECELEDSKATEKARYALDWFWLSRSQEADADPKQIRLVLEIRSKLKEYSTVYRKPEE